MAAWTASDSPAEFWARFSVDGTRMSLSKIASVLKGDRQMRDERQASEARNRYGEDLKGHSDFSYTKGGRKFWYSRDRDIARMFQKISGLIEVSLHF